MRHSVPFAMLRFIPYLIVGILMSAILLIVALHGSIAHADAGPKFGLQPVLYDPSNPVTKSYFVFDSSAGMILHNRIRVTNSGATTGTVSLYAVDATTGQTSGVVYLSGNNARRDVGTWITLGLQNVTLLPGQSRIIPFQVAIPRIIRPGQHVGGIVAESKAMGSKSTPGASSIQINVQSLTIVAVQINLPGTAIEQLETTGIRPGGENGYQNLLIHLSNTGTMMLKPFGNLQVIDVQGKVIQNLPLKLDTLLPQTTIDYPVYVKGQALKAGDYRVELTLMYGHNKLLHYIQVFTVTQQQLHQVFTSSTQPLAPETWGNFLGTMPMWQTTLGGVLLASGFCFWGQKLYQWAMISRRRVSSEGKKAN